MTIRLVGRDAHPAIRMPAVTLDVRKEQERLDHGILVTVLQTTIHVGEEHVGDLDCLVFEADTVIDSDALRRACAGQLWDLHEIVGQAFGERGRIENCFADGAFVVLEHVLLKPPYRYQRIGERALRSILSQHVPRAVRWLYVNVDDPQRGEGIERWLGAIFPSQEAAVGSYAYMRYALHEQADEGACTVGRS